MTYQRKTRDELLAALEALTQTFIDGTHYETVNPYCRPEVKRALVAIGKARGTSVFGNDWIDALKPRHSGH
jgi:hypothetical protein